MKKNIVLFSAVLALASLGINVNAQISKGGLPLTMQKENAVNTVPISIYPNPDWNAYLESELKDVDQKFSTMPVKIGLHAATNFGFPNSGQIEVLNNGQKIWRGAIQIDGAPAMGFLFDKFQLPKGVQLFLTNENKRQIVGAFDSENNDPSQMFFIDAVQGSKVFLELNIDANVNIDDIKLHIDRILVFHRAIEHLQTYLIAGDSPLDALDASLNGGSSQCNINAICPTGSNYPNPRKATIQTIDATSGAGCSGTLVNHTGNSTTSCKPYIFTATHCEGTGQTNSNTAVFNQMLVRFNFERPSCDNNGATDGKSMTGVNIIARSAYTAPMQTNLELLGGDFLLLELRQTIPASYGAVFSGWDVGTFATTVSAPKKFIGFHHPKGDNKKLSSSQTIMSASWPEQTPNPNGTRWISPLTEGYVSKGSSGSGLFNGDGYVIGTASVAGTYGSIPAECNTKANGGPNAEPMNAVLYQKMSSAWNYNDNGIAGSNSLKPFLDPLNTGQTKINSVTQTCASITTGGGTDGNVSVNRLNKDLNSNIAVFPNPNADGKVNLQFNFSTATNVNITVVDLVGKVVYTTNINNVSNGIKTLNLENLANGMYMIKIASPDGYASKKLLLNK